MNLLFAIAPEQFRDEELEIPRRIFKEAGIGVDIASTTPRDVHGDARGRCRGDHVI